MKEIAIIGGGASGLFSAVYLKKLINEANITEEVNITIYERLEKTGKKILVTGNGRCNFTNIHVDEKKYNNSNFVKKTVKSFNGKKIIEYFKELGMYSVVDTEGRAYPKSEIASTVVDILRTNLKLYNVVESCNSEVKRIYQQNEGFILETTRNVKIYVDYLIVATGGKSAQIHGSNGSGYGLLKPLKIKVTDTRPGLVSLKSDDQLLKSLAGIRVKCKVSLYDIKLKEIIFQEHGEALFKNDGLSGIVIMQAETFMARKPSNYRIVLDLLPELSWDELFEELQNRKITFKAYEATNILTGLFNKMLNLAIFKRAKVDLSSYASELTNPKLARITSTIKEFDIDVKQATDFDKSQVTVGGVSTDEINDKTMEVKKIPNLYVVGELLDVDGECGGYNLHWAFASASVASLAILNKLKSKDNA